MELVFFPARFLDQIKRMSDLIQIVDDKMTTVNINGLPTIGYIGIIEKGHTVTSLFDHEDIHRPILLPRQEDRSKHRAVHVVTPNGAKERERLTYAVGADFEPNSILARDIHEVIVDRIYDCAINIALVSGKEVELHFGDVHSVFQPYFETGRIHFVFDMSPPGSTNVQEVAKIFDYRVAPAGEVQVAHGPSEDICGLTIPEQGDEKDDEFYIGQIIGETIYVFVPIRKDTLPILTNEQNPLIQSMQKVWSEYDAIQLSDKDTLSLQTISSYEEFASHQKQVRSKTHQRFQKKYDVLQNDIEQLETRLREAYDSQMIYRAILTGAKTFPQHDSEKDWEELKRCPYFSHLTRNKIGIIHYHSQPVHILDVNGELRDVGSFSIRFRAGESLILWSNRITHPSRIPHPHIGTQGQLCFGNVSTLMQKYSGTGEEIKAILLALRWLFEGYESALAEHKLEEWPTVEEISRRAQKRKVHTNDESLTSIELV